MKVTHIVLAMMLTVVTGFQAMASDVYMCKGKTTSSDGKILNVNVLADEPNRKMTITLSENSQLVSTTELYIKSVKLGFPAYVINASRDLRMVDGGLTEASLAIMTEVMRPGVSNPSLLKLSTSPGRSVMNDIKTHYKLECAQAIPM